MPPASHKPRKKQRLHIAFSSPDFPLVALLWPVRTNASQWLVLPLVLAAAALFRWAVGFWPYSGFQAPPMHGDFEAQRHWMELTANLPVAEWYFYDLQWWGLDYPPLTAYHSWVLGKMYVPLAGGCADREKRVPDQSRVVCAQNVSRPGRPGPDHLHARHGAGV
jgi:alpha-1,3-glucosyltransferase